MPATAATNRVAPSFAEPRKPLSPLPAAPEARPAALADAVFAAVLALPAQLAHPDPAVVRTAAGMILDFEKTRLRHGRAVAGTTLPPPDPSVAGVWDPGPASSRPATEDAERRRMTSWPTSTCRRRTGSPSGRCWRSGTGRSGAGGRGPRGTRRGWPGWR